MTAFTEGLKILRKITEEEKHWRSGLLRIEELLQAAEHAERVVLDAAQKEQTLQASIASLGADQIALQKSLKLVQGEVSGWKGDLAAKEKIAAERLGELDRQIEVKEQRLQELTAKLDDVRARATV